MGRTKKPLAHLKLHGGYRADRHASLDVDAVENVPNPPAKLSKEARKYWDEIADQLTREGVLTALDMESLAILCEELATYWKLREFFRSNFTTYSVDESIRERPEMRQMNRAREVADQLMRQFGMTPVARRSIVPSKPVQAVERRTRA